MTVSSVEVSGIRFDNKINFTHSNMSQIEKGFDKRLDSFKFWILSLSADVLYCKTFK